MRENIFIIDPFVHKKTKLSRDEFLNRFQFVKAIRTRNQELSFYFDSPDKWENIEHFHYLINNGDFSKQKISRQIPFAFSIPKLLFNWMKETPLLILQKQIMFWLSGYYVFNSFREFIPGELLPHIWNEVSDIVNKYYPADFIERFKEEDEFDNYDLYKKRNEENTKLYLEAAKLFIGRPLPEIFFTPNKNPIIFDRELNWGLNDKLQFEYSISYLTKEDWDNIIINEIADDLLRNESDREMFGKWKHTYKMYEIRGNNIFSLYTNVEKKKESREKIPQHIIDKVWRRDLGQCAICGSKEKLEIDHIIPVSKGGSSTYRNLQLLCEKHNRSKHNSIG
jgi:hypothetical protein